MFNKDSIIMIDNIKYVDVITFAGAISKTTHAVYHYIKDGNSIRKLKCKRIGGKPLIPASELTEYPFTIGGPTGVRKIYHYRSDGTILEMSKDKWIDGAGLDNGGGIDNQ